MKLFTQTDAGEGEPERHIYTLPASHAEVVVEVIRSLPLHLKLILYSFLKLHEQKKKDAKIRVDDVFFQYKRLTTELNFICLSENQVADKIREFDMLGLIRCKYIRKGSGQIKYINVYHQAELSNHIAVLQKAITNIKPEELAVEKLIMEYQNANTDFSK